jgi:alcohol dehydrogenase
LNSLFQLIEINMDTFQFSTTKSIISGPGSIHQIAQVCAQLQIKKPMIITDMGIVSCGLMAQCEKVFMAAELDYAVFNDVVADPDENIIKQAVDAAASHQCDGVIGYGGGSSMDTAKLVAVLLVSMQPLADLYGINNIKGSRLPLILIPTTAGTGSEVTPIAIVTTGETTKAGIVASQLLPDVALLDANLTLDLPSHVTAATGIDAMVHAIEAFTSKNKKNPYSDMLAKQALSLLANNIEDATFDGHNISARQNMLLGACLAGQAFANSPVAAVHALAYPLGGHFHIPHGLSNALVLPHVLRFNSKESSELYSELAPYISSSIDLNTSSESISEAMIEYIQHLIERLKLPTKLHQLGIKKSQLPLLAKDALLQTRLLVNNPRILSYQDALHIYNQAYGE